MNAILNSVKNNIVQWIALGLSIVNMFFLLKEKWKEKVKLDIIQDKEAYSFKFPQYGDNQYAFCFVKIINKSKTETSVTKINLIDSAGNSIPACYFEHHSNPLNNDDELCFFNEDMSRYLNFNIDSENLLNNPRLESYGEIEGYLFFKNVSPLTDQPKTFTLKIEIPTKVFTKNIVFTNLPKGFMSYVETRRHLM